MTTGDGGVAWIGQRPRSRRGHPPDNAASRCRSGDQWHTAALRTTVALRVLPGQRQTLRGDLELLGGAAVRQAYEPLVASVAGEAGPGSEQDALPLRRRGECG